MRSGMWFSDGVINTRCHKLWAVALHEITELDVVLVKDAATT